MNLNSLRTDASKETEGVWVPITPEASVKVRYTDTLAFRRAVKKKYKPYSNAIRAAKDDAIPEAEQERISIALIVDEVLVDWRGITDGDVALPFTKDNARMALAIKPFRDMVETAAADISNFRAEQLVEDAKN